MSYRPFNSAMDFVPEPEAAKKFGIKWIKYRLMKYPHVFFIFWPVPFIIPALIHKAIYYRRATADGTYVPNVVRNAYHICRSDDYAAKMMPSRYRN